ncbi:MAG: DNA polymerase III subunit gamma/tau [Alphaproteobacteria bacterium]|nr:DNA polymerase III subunit gamma/tau [Alphaproteobacteria bacterium]
MTELFPSSPIEAPAYRVLARKYRPSTFEELIGQEAMVQTLTNAIEAGRLSHAWMLTGVRGIGKTTTARLIARALNCTGPDGKGGPTIHPCGQCDACRAIAEDRHVDVQELDAASRTGVDDIRDIIEGVRYGPVSARYKIYILDEVHMLSKNAFNALLKTLEEPPPHVKFIFATTEIRKVPVTVLSRCQRFDLRRIDSARLAAHFTAIAAKEKVETEPEAIKLIAQAADGSVRDGLSLLDQAIARGNGAVRETEVKDMLGLADRAQSLVLCRRLLRGEMREALEAYGAFLQAGTDPLQVLQDLAGLVHLLTRAQIVADLASAPDLPEAERGLLLELADIKVPALTRGWQILLKGINEVQVAPRPAEAAEMVLIRLAYAADLPPPAELVRQLREGMSAASTTSSSGTPPSGGGSGFGVRGSGALATARETVPAQAAPAVAPVASSSMPATFRDVVALFAANREGGLYAQLCNFVHAVRCEPGRLEVRLEANASPGLVNRVGHCLTQWTERRWMVSVVDQPGAPTLAEEQKKAEEDHQALVRSHPLMQAVMTAFPEAKILSLKQKTVALAAPPREDETLENEEPQTETENGEQT